MLALIQPLYLFSIDIIDELDYTLYKTKGGYMLYTELKTLTESCNTIKEISISAGKSETTIKYWLKKHDLKIIKAKTLFAAYLKFK